MDGGGGAPYTRVAKGPDLTAAWSRKCGLTRSDVSPWTDEEISTLIRLWPTQSGMNRKHLAPLAFGNTQQGKRVVQKRLAGRQERLARPIHQTRRARFRRSEDGLLPHAPHHRGRTRRKVRKRPPACGGVVSAGNSGQALKAALPRRGKQRGQERSGFSRVGLAARRVPSSAPPGPRLRGCLQGLPGLGSPDRRARGAPRSQKASCPSDASGAGDCLLGFAFNNSRFNAALDRAV